MKIKTVSFLATVIFISLAIASKGRAASASQGHAKLVLDEKQQKPITYNFTGILPSQLACVERQEGPDDPDKYADISMIQLFENGDDTYTQLTVRMRIQPSGVGTFKLSPDDVKTPEGHISISAGARLLLDGQPENGTGGTITIENYPAAVGGFLKGALDVTLIDQEGKLVHVSGEFYIKRKTG